MIWELKNKLFIIYQVQEEMPVVQEIDESLKSKPEDLLCPKVKILLLLLKHMKGRAIAQAVSRWLPNRSGPGWSPVQVLWYLWWTNYH
jgi:hypothetical protein